MEREADVELIFQPTRRRRREQLGRRAGKLAPGLAKHSDCINKSARADQRRPERPTALGPWSFEAEQVELCRRTRKVLGGFVELPQIAVAEADVVQDVDVHGRAIDRRLLLN